MSAYKRGFDKTELISFLIKNDEFLEKYNEIWDNFNNTIKKEFHRELVYNEKYIRTRIKFSEGKLNTNFHDNKMPKEESQCISLSVIFVDSVFRLGKNYHRQVF